MINFGTKQIALWKIAMATCALYLGQAAVADELVIGNDVIDRPSEDTWHDIVISLDTEIFPIEGQVIDWSVYATSDGELALLILNDGEVMATDRREVTAGYNFFEFHADSGTDLVSEGFNVGLWMGSAGVAFTYGDFEDENLDEFDAISWCPTDGCFSDAPLAGEVLELTSTKPWMYRQYSVSVTDPPVAAAVPAPGTFALIGLTLLGLIKTARKTA